MWSGGGRGRGGKNREREEGGNGVRSKKVRNSFIQIPPKTKIIQRHFHPKTGSSTDIFDHHKFHHPKTVHPKTVSSISGFVQFHIVQFGPFFMAFLAPTDSLSKDLPSSSLSPGPRPPPVKGRLGSNKMTQGNLKAQFGWLWPPHGHKSTKRPKREIQCCTWCSSTSRPHLQHTLCRTKWYETLHQLPAACFFKLVLRNGLCEVEYTFIQKRFQPKCTFIHRRFQKMTLFIQKTFPSNDTFVHSHYHPNAFIKKKKKVRPRWVGGPKPGKKGAEGLGPTHFV